jgi:hypothetical protein
MDLSEDGYDTAGVVHHCHSDGKTMIARRSLSVLHINETERRVDQINPVARAECPLREKENQSHLHKIIYRPFLK